MQVLLFLDFSSTNAAPRRARNTGAQIQAPRLIFIIWFLIHQMLPHRMCTICVKLSWTELALGIEWISTLHSYTDTKLTHTHGHTHGRRHLEPFGSLCAILILHTCDGGGLHDTMNQYVYWTSWHILSSDAKRQRKPDLHYQCLDMLASAVMHTHTHTNTYTCTRTHT